MKWSPLGLMGQALFAPTLAVLFTLLAGIGYAQPVNDSFASRIFMTGTNLIATGYNVGATSEPGEPFHAGDFGGCSVWWSWTAPRSGPVVICTTGSSFDTLLAVYLGSSLWGLTEVASNDEDPDSYYTSKVEFDAVAGQSYAIAVDGYYGDTGTITLQLFQVPPPSNDLFANRITLAGTNISALYYNVHATREPGEPYHAGQSGAKSVWWSWTAPFTGTATISTAGSTFDTLLGVYLGSTLAGLTEVASNDEGPNGDSTSEVQFDTLAGQTYQIAVDGYYGVIGTVRLQVRLAPPQPPAPAPAWTLLDPYGQSVSSSSFAGKVVLLNFWATWCGPCKAELPDLVALQDKYRADGLVIVGADVPWRGDDWLTVQSFLASFTPTINYQVVMATTTTTWDYGNITSIPTTFLIDRQNRIRKKFVDTQSRSTFEQQIVRLLYGQTPLVWQRNGNHALLRWPVTAQSFTLESTPTLSDPVWAPWPTAPTVLNGTNTLQVPATEAARYFRLRMAY